MMPTGLAIPVGVNPSGGAAIVTGDENDRKIIRAALGSDDNENAFQQGQGLGEGMIFDIADATTRAEIQRKLIEVFDRFAVQKRYILRRPTLRWEEDQETQAFILSFKYLNVESDEEKQFRESFSGDRRDQLDT